MGAIAAAACRDGLRAAGQMRVGDGKVTLASHSEEIAASIPGAQLVLLPGVHLLNVERPAEFMGAVARFLGGAVRDAA